jgi:hypothetical protein
MAGGIENAELMQEAPVEVTLWLRIEMSTD